MCRPPRTRPGRRRCHTTPCPACQKPSRRGPPSRLPTRLTHHPRPRPHLPLRRLRPRFRRRLPARFHPHLAARFRRRPPPHRLTPPTCHRLRLSAPADLRPPAGTRPPLWPPSLPTPHRRPQHRLFRSGPPYPPHQPGTRLHRQAPRRLNLRRFPQLCGRRRRTSPRPWPRTSSPLHRLPRLRHPHSRPGPQSRLRRGRRTTRRRSLWPRKRPCLQCRRQLRHAGHRCHGPKTASPATGPPGCCRRSSESSSCCCSSWAAASICYHGLAQARSEWRSTRRPRAASPRPRHRRRRRTPEAHKPCRFMHQPRRRRSRASFFCLTPRAS